MSAIFETPLVGLWPDREFLLIVAVTTETI